MFVFWPHLPHTALVLRGAHLVHHHRGDGHHGRHGDEPAQPVSPGGVVVVRVLTGRVVDPREEHDELGGETEDFIFLCVISLAIMFLIFF